MYSQKIINDHLALFERQEGWLPIPRTSAQIQEFTENLKSIVNMDVRGRNKYFALKKKITKQTADRIRRWIENEQIMCAFDSNYFEDRYAYVCDEKGDIFKFKNRFGQQVFDNVIAENEERGVSIELLCLKARQQGLTTKTALKFLHRVLFVPHTQAVMGSVIEAKSELITRIIETCIEHLPWWLPPSRSVDKRNMTEFVNGSVISIQSGNQATGIAQGWTPTMVHISEIQDIPNPKKSIEEGLLHATHSTKKLFMVFEGTGNGNTGWLADKWRSSKEKWPLGQSRLRPVFIPWPMTPELYPTPDFIRDHPVPPNFRPIEATRKHVQRCELFVRSTDYLANVVGKNWQMPMHQQWYWEWNYLQAVDSHTQKIWFSQKPADDYEALTGANDLVFDTIVLDTARTQRERNYQAYAITGDSIDDGFEPLEEEIDYNKPRIRVKWRSHRGQNFEWVMVPLRPFDEDEERQALGKVLVFEEPNSQPGHEGEPENYSCGIDTADGLGNDDEDRSVLSIARSVTGENCDVQVCEFASNRVNPPQMVGFAACLAAWYGQNTRDPRGVKFAIEQRERPGDDCQLQLKLMGFNFHHVDTRYDNKKLAENKGHKEGWYSNVWSVPLLMNRFVDAVNNGWYKPNSPFLIQELASLERKMVKSGKTKMEHQQGKHDDRIRAAAQSYFTRHAFDVLAERAQKRYAPPVSRVPEVDYGYANTGQVAVGDW